MTRLHCDSHEEAAHSKTNQSNQTIQLTYYSKFTVSKLLKHCCRLLEKSSTRCCAIWSGKQGVLITGTTAIKLLSKCFASLFRKSCAAKSSCLIRLHSFKSFWFVMKYNSDTDWGMACVIIFNVIILHVSETKCLVFQQPYKVLHHNTHTYL